MKRIIKTVKRVVLSFLALLIFANSTSFAMDVHTCSGEVASVSFFGKAGVCEKMAQSDISKLPPCCREMLRKQLQEGVNFSKKSCCKNTSFELNSLQGLEVSSAISYCSDIYNFSDHLFFEPNSILQKVHLVNEKTILFPPSREFFQDDFHSLFQVFII